MLRAININPTALVNIDREERVVFGEFLIIIAGKFVARKIRQAASANDLILSHNLLLDQENQDPKVKRYYVISNDQNDILGKGGFSRARKTSGYVEVNLITHDVIFVSNQEKAARIQNTKQAQKSHINNNTTYSHEEANKNYLIGQYFTYLGLQPPVEVKKHYAAFGLFSKSYSLMNVLPFPQGQGLRKAVSQLFEKDLPDLLMVIDFVILPILSAYKEQIAKSGYVHRDIKIDNLVAYINVSTNPPISKIYFLDVDSALKIGESDTYYGSPGYLPPELKKLDTGEVILVIPARDLFALGVLLIASIQPSLDPNQYFGGDLGYTNWEVAQDEAIKQIIANGCYDPAKMPNAKGDCYNLFQWMEDGDLLTFGELPLDAYQEVEHLFKQMTHVDPVVRKDIDCYIERFTVMRNELEDKKNNPIITRGY